MFYLKRYEKFQGRPLQLQFFLTKSDWTKSSESMDNVQSVHGQWTLSVDIVQSAWTPWTLSKVSMDIVQTVR